MAASTLEWLECTGCRSACDIGSLHGLCRCGGILLARYRLEEASRTLTRESVIGRAPTLWRYAEMLPGSDDPLTLGEGMTPLHRARFLGDALGLLRLYIKDESPNPTGSFKARGMATAITMARRLGVKRVALPSAGNAGAAAAAYTALAGMAADVFLPADTPEPFRLEAAAYGARVRLVPGDISDCARRMREDAEAGSGFDLSTFREPYRVEGKKTLGYEMAEQLDWDLPDVVVFPTGGGTGLVGAWKAFEEMAELGLVAAERKPRLVAVQAAGCAPIVQAFESGAERPAPWPGPETRALGLRVPSPFAGHLILQALRESGGVAVAVGEREIADSQLEMARGEGIFACPEGGATLAAAKHLLSTGFLSPDDCVVLLNTGTGLTYGRVPGLRVP